MAQFSLSSVLPNAEAIRSRTAWVCELFHATGMGRAGIRHARKRGCIPMLLYHSVRDLPENAARHTCFMAMGMVVERGRFEAHMDFLSRSATVIGLDEVAIHLQEGTRLPPDAVVLTFDDGFRDNAAVAAPILRRHGFRATFFPIGSLFDSTTLPWPHALYHMLDALEGKPFRIALPDFPCAAGALLTENGKLRLARSLKPRLETLPPGVRESVLKALCERNGLPVSLLRCEGMFMSGADLHRLSAEGHLIGGHSMQHLPLPGLPPAACREEAAQNRMRLRTFGVNDFASFAYPYGSHDAGVRRTVRESGFDCGVTTSEGLNIRNTDLFALQRIYIGNFGVAEFETHLSGAPAALLRLARGCY
jgi:peptidoglycan/xylan/chitin deacetylase (PgdA/CDA1 family)